MEPVNALQVIFSKLSQMLYSLSLLAIAAVEWRYHQDLFLPTAVAVPISILLALLSVMLLAWSAVDGLRQLLRAGQRVPLAMLACIYLCVLLMAVHAFPSLILRR
jgi:hypothetical protein